MNTHCVKNTVGLICDKAGCCQEALQHALWWQDLLLLTSLKWTVYINAVIDMYAAHVWTWLSSSSDG